MLKRIMTEVTDTDPADYRPLYSLRKPIDAAYVVDVLMFEASISIM